MTYRRKRQLYIAILKQLGFGQRRMEHRINVEVAELVHQLRLTGGQPFDPSEILHSCILNVINSIVFGQRRPYGHPELVQLRNCLQAMYDNIAAEVELFPILRFFPFYRSRYNKSVTRARNLLNTLRQKVNDGNVRHFSPNLFRQINPKANEVSRSFIQHSCKEKLCNSDTSFICTNCSRRPNKMINIIELCLIVIKLICPFIQPSFANHMISTTLSIKPNSTSMGSDFLDTGIFLYRK